MEIENFLQLFVRLKNSDQLCEELVDGEVSLTSSHTIL